MTHPLIGITTNQITYGRTLQPRIALNTSYVNAVQRAGGIPLLIPVGIPASQYDNLLGKLDGIMFTGGVDINPARYGAPLHPEITEVDLERDEMELDMLAWTVRQDKPFFGICRGVELVNVGLGGDLYTHLYDQLPNALFHTCYNGDLPRSFLAHSVKVEPGSKLEQVLGGGDVWVNSLHHQGIRKLGKGLRATAKSSDGLVEGIELEDHPYGVAVQWHPEELTHVEPMFNLFKAFVAASSK
jgi:putative glutamine amidotransferase